MSENRKAKKSKKETKIINKKNREKLVVLQRQKFKSTFFKDLRSNNNSNFVKFEQDRNKSNRVSETRDTFIQTLEFLFLAYYLALPHKLASGLIKQIKIVFVLNLLPTLSYLLINSFKRYFVVIVVVVEMICSLAKIKRAKKKIIDNNFANCCIC